MIRSYFVGLPGSGRKIMIGERRMVVLSDEAMLCVGFYVLTRVRDGRPVPGDARFTMVLARRNGVWLIAHHHSSWQPNASQ
jgi:hypothetical protein